MRRVVVTGLGAVTPIGNNVEEFWNGIKAGKCGIDKVTLFDATDFKTQIAGEIKNFEPTDFIEKKDARKMDRSEEHTSELQSHHALVCRLLLE